MEFLKPTGHAALAELAHEEVGVLSLDRWGVGSLVTIGAFIGAGSFFLLRWSSTKGALSFLMAVLLLGGGAIMLAVKTVENIDRVEFTGYDPVGKTGKVTVAYGGATCAVRIDGLDWSATSEKDLDAGDEVLVVGRDGLHVFVRKTSRNPAA